MFFIPFISSILYLAGGQYNKWFRWLMGVPIAIILHNWMFIITYYIAGAVFVYGDNSWVSKLVGRKGARIIHGLAFGLASLQPIFAIWTTITFYILFELAEHDVIDNKYSELGRGFLGTIMYVFN